MSSIQLNNIVKNYDTTQVVHGVDLNIDDGEFVVLLGPSGCGKSTILRMVAGLEDITSGELQIGGALANDKAPKDRGIAMVFQNYALYPHMSVRKNMEFALRPLKLGATEVERRIAETAEMLGLSELLQRKPAQLSGGQRQRVAMGRAMVRTPQVFLFDEPLSNLDAKLRTQVRWEIGRLHKRLGVTVLYVTHDQVEAMTLADKIVILRDGRVEQVGSPEAVYSRPNNTFVATFIGSPSMNLLPGVIREGNIVIDDLRLSIPPFYQNRVSEGQVVTLGIRPADIELSETKGTESQTANVVVTEFLGNEALLDVCFGDHEMIIEVPAPQRPEQGAPVHLNFRPECIHLFDAESGAALS